MARKFVAERGARGPTADRSVRRPRYVSQPAHYTLNEALEIFVQAKLAEGVRERTAQEYRSHVRYLVEFAGDITLDQLTPQMIRDYVNYLLRDKRKYEGVDVRKTGPKGLAPNTVNMRLRTLKTMCRFWYAEGLAEHNPMASIKQVRADQQDEVPGLTDAEIEAILNYYDERQYAEWRDKTLIYLLLDTGLRINEAVTLTVDQIDMKRLEIEVPSEVAKNRRYRYVPLTHQVARRINELHNESMQYFGRTDRIFMNAYGEPFTASAFRRRLNRLKKKLDIERLHPHQFRHTFARNYLLNGGDLFTLQKILDHADIKTTRKYVQMDKDHIRQQHTKHSPVRRYLR